MIKGIRSNGVVVPRDPLPDDWKEATEVAVERFPADAVPVKDSACTDAWMNEVEAIAGQGDPKDDERLDAAVREVRRREKDLARKRLGLPS